MLVSERVEYLMTNARLDTFSRKFAVIFQHIPFFLQHPEEDDSGYFTIDKAERLPLLDKLHNLGQLRYTFLRVVVHKI